MDYVSVVGENAGKVWHVLDEQGPQNVTQLKKKVGGSNGAVEMALGWLAREGKIEFEQQKKSLIIKLK